MLDDGSGISPEAVQFAKELTEEIRRLPKTGTGPYALAPGSDKDLVEMKLRRSATSWRPIACCTGRSSVIPDDESSGAALAAWGEKLYAELTAATDQGAAVIGADVDRGPVSAASAATATWRSAWARASAAAAAAA